MDSPNTPDEILLVRRGGFWYRDVPGYPALPGLNGTSPPPETPLFHLPTQQPVLPALGVRPQQLAPASTVETDVSEDQDADAWFTIGPDRSDLGPLRYLHLVPGTERRKYVWDVTTHTKDARAQAEQIVAESPRNAGLDAEARTEAAKSNILKKLATYLKKNKDSPSPRLSLNDLFQMNGPLFQTLKNWLKNELRESRKKRKNHPSESEDIGRMIQGEAEPGHVFTIARRLLPAILKGHAGWLRQTAANIKRKMPGKREQRMSAANRAQKPPTRKRESNIQEQTMLVKRPQAHVMPDASLSMTPDHYLDDSSSSRTSQYVSPLSSGADLVSSDGDSLLYSPTIPAVRDAPLFRHQHRQAADSLGNHTVRM